MLVRVSAALVLALSALHAQQAQPVGPGGTLAVVRSQPASVSVAPVTTAVTVDFDRPVDLSSVTTSTFRVFGRYSGPARGSYSFAHGARRVTFTPERPFSAGEVVWVNLSHDLRGMDRSRLRAAGHAIQFATSVQPSSGTFVQ